MRELTIDEFEIVSGGTDAGDIAMGLAGAHAAGVAGLAVGAIVGGPAGMLAGYAAGFVLGGLIVVGYAFATC